MGRSAWASSLLSRVTWAAQLGGGVLVIWKLPIWRSCRLHKYRIHRSFLIIATSSPTHYLSSSSFTATAAEMRKPGKATVKPSSSAKKVSNHSKIVRGVKSCRNCRNGQAPCLSPGSVNMCCNCLNPEWHTCVNGCLSSDTSTDGESSYKLSPSQYIQELQIKKLQENAEAMARQIDDLQKKQVAMSSQIVDLKKEVDANFAKI
ncbi:unnamed protein product [Miscanthus lutarioriparius]|uniref:Uncharacterized protein n=1 Tax=Miscanthus lutarioriparius TaxID=422564 RepID=A0A811RVX9_9POAL|nr:unnamed protein product [Miscanthus lutarioriparius]